MIDPNLIQILEKVSDPEIPVLSVLDLGVVRSAKYVNNQIELEITPTYSGCPAMKMIEDELIAAFNEEGFSKVIVRLIYAPAWTTDWMTESGKLKLQEYGIAPPEHSSSDKSLITGKPKTIICPQCKSNHTELISQFGSTACKALYRCLECREPFDYFKCI
jgi:ring-1,2-phenylacetyl-CoA epoxidase subunit PaaD